MYPFCTRLGFAVPVIVPVVRTGTPDLRRYRMKQGVDRKADFYRLFASSTVLGATP